MANIIKHPDFETDTKKAIAQSFMRTQEDLKEMTNRLGWSNTVGSTAVTVMMKGKRMFVAWAGDSLATLYKAGDQFVELIDSHKPGKPVSLSGVEGGWRYGR